MSINAKWGGWASPFDEANLLGEVVAFEVRGLSVPFSRVQQALGEAGMDTAMARAIVPARALRRAVAKMRGAHVVGQIEDTANRIVFQFSKAVKSDRGKELWASLEYDGVLEYQGEGRVVMDKETGGMTGDSAELLGVVQNLLGEAIENRTTSDITSLCNQAFRKFGDLFPLRKSGGCYFVPAKHSGLVDCVAKFLEGVGGKMCRYPVAKGHLTGETSVRDAIRDGIRAMIEDHKSAINGFEAKTRDKTMAKELDEIKLTRFKIDAYTEYLAEETEQLKAEAEAADKLWQAKVEAVLEEREAEVDPVEKEIDYCDKICDEVNAELSAMSPEDLSQAEQEACAVVGV